METPQPQEEVVFEWDYEFECFRANGILDPTLIRSTHLPPPSVGSSAPPVSHEAGPSAEPQPHEPANQAGVRRKRDLQASHVLERRLYSFQLFLCRETQENILAMTEVGTVNTIFFALLPYEKNGKRKIEAKEINIGLRVISPAVEEIFENVDNRSNLSMEQRLEGKWTIELRRRNGTMKTERFYSHERVDRTFRSMNEVATFIGYNVIY